MLFRSEVRKHYIKYVSITGGNPLEQNLEELIELIRELKQRKYKISIEVTGNEKTNKSIEKIFNSVDFISFDMKSPSSKTENHFHKSNVGWNYKAQYKIVVADRSDYKFAKEMINKYRMCDIILTPAWNFGKEIDKNFVKDIYKRVLDDNLKTRVIVQQHKIIYGASIKRSEEHTSELQSH